VEILGLSQKGQTIKITNHKLDGALGSRVQRPAGKKHVVADVKKQAMRVESTGRISRAKAGWSPEKRGGGRTAPPSRATPGWRKGALQGKKTQGRGLREGKFAARRKKRKNLRGKPKANPGVDEKNTNERPVRGEKIRRRSGCDETGS